MNANIKFNEITRFVEKTYNLKIGIVTIDKKTIEIGYKPKLFLPQILVKLHIVGINKECIELSYDANMGLSAVTSIILPFLQEKIPTGVKIDTNNNIVKVFPQQIEKADKILKHFSTADIVFNSDEAIATLELA